MTSRNGYAELLAVELPRVMNEVICGLLGEHAENSEAPAPHDTPLSCSVRIHGGFEGEVIVRATLGLASRIAEKMFEDDLDGDPTPGDARDALREVANIVAGNLKPLFGCDNQLGLPEDLAENAETAQRGQLARATLEHAAGALDVVVYTSL